MKLVMTGKLTAGTVLARDVRGPDGTLIAAKGVTLTQATIARLERLNVRHVMIEGEDDARRQRLQARLDTLGRRFRGHEADPFMTAIQQAVRVYLQQSLSGEA